MWFMLNTVTVNVALAYQTPIQSVVLFLLYNLPFKLKCLFLLSDFIK